MKKTLIFSAVALLTVSLAGCGNSTSKKNDSSSNSIKIAKQKKAESIKKAKLESTKRAESESKVKAKKESEKKTVAVSQASSANVQSSATTQSTTVSSSQPTQSTAQNTQQSTTKQTHVPSADDPNSAENIAAHKKGGMLYGAPKGATVGAWKRSEDAPTAKWRAEHGYGN